MVVGRITSANGESGHGDWSRQRNSVYLRCSSAVRGGVVEPPPPSSRLVEPFLVSYPPERSSNAVLGKLFVPFNADW